MLENIYSTPGPDDIINEEKRKEKFDKIFKEIRESDLDIINILRFCYSKFTSEFIIVMDNTKNIEKNKNGITKTSISILINQCPNINSYKLRIIGYHHKYTIIHHFDKQYIETQSEYGNLYCKNIPKIDKCKLLSYVQKDVLEEINKIKNSNFKSHNGK